MTFAHTHTEVLLHLGCSLCGNHKWKISFSIYSVLISEPLSSKGKEPKLLSPIANVCTQDTQPLYIWIYFIHSTECKHLKAQNMNAIENVDELNSPNEWSFVYILDDVHVSCVLWLYSYGISAFIQTKNASIHGIKVMSSFFINFINFPPSFHRRNVIYSSTIFCHFLLFNAHILSKKNEITVLLHHDKIPRRVLNIINLNPAKSAN